MNKARKGCLTTTVVWIAISGVIATMAAPGDGIFTFSIFLILGLLCIGLVFGVLGAMKLGGMAGTGLRQVAEKQPADALNDELSALRRFGGRAEAQRSSSTSQIEQPKSYRRMTDAELCEAQIRASELDDNDASAEVAEEMHRRLARGDR